MNLKLTVEDSNVIIIGICLEGFLYGLYSGIFAMYSQDHWASIKPANKTKNFLFYALCALYILSLVNIVLDMTVTSSKFHQNPNLSPTVLLDIYIIQGAVIGCCDFIAQSILIYRCWIVWDCNIRVVVIPSIFAFVFLAMWLTGVNSPYILSNQVVEPSWGIWLAVASLAMSMIVNALVTGLIIFKIFNMYREVKSTSVDQTLGLTGGSKIRTVIFILIESGMVLFSFQLARLVVTVFQTMDATIKASYIMVNYIHQMLNCITPTIILVRISMELSFHDKESTESTSSVGSLRFAANPNLISETGDVGIVPQESGDDDTGSL
ncbi:hypothetical protein BYT27DRAFT_7189166 [Phlegmacium glaucopus]|nr:hypothetical protein BYT27DRAFT_7189166 [Phlegmacium glaucopus]